MRREKKKGWKVSFSPSYFHGWEEEEEKVLPLRFALVRPLTDEREDEHGRKGERKKVREGEKVCGVGFSSKYS